MAAVLTPRPASAAPGPPGVRRPHLHLVEPLPVEPLFSARAIAGAVVIALVFLVGVVAIGRGALSDLAPSPTGPTAAASTGGAASARTVVAQPGDTLWSIARDLQPAGDIRPLVDALVAANGSTAIDAGDRIVVPE